GSYTWDDANQLIKLANIRSDATTISSFAYKNDPVGNRTRVVEANGDRVTWTYDPSYQLLSERRSGANGFAITYSYDKSRNRRTMLQSGVTTTYTCDAANQLNWYQDNTGRTTMVYDSDGNQTVVVVPTGGRTSSTWDYEKRTTKVLLASGTRN